jgi:hypothetical protein
LNVQAVHRACHDPWSIRRATLALTAVVLAALVAGCGGDASGEAPAAQAPTGAFPAKGVSFKAPEGWAVGAGRGTLVATVQAGDATVAVWRFPRKQKLPRSKAELTAARDALLVASRKEDATFTEIKTAPTEIAGQPAVQIRARETISGQPRTVRSTHIYAHGAEYVIDAFTDADSFRATDATFFRPLLRSLTISKPQGTA